MESLSISSPLLLLQEPQLSLFYLIILHSVTAAMVQFVS